MTNPSPSSNIRYRSTLDLIGQPFGNLTVIGRAPSHSRSHGSYWFCKCICGDIKSYRRQSLVKRIHKTSCGCIKEPYLSRQVDPTKQLQTELYNRYKRGARDRNIEFKLYSDEVYKLSQGACVYCGLDPITPRVYYKGYSYEVTLYSNGIDRVNNTIGYLPTNVVSCCRYCNYAKHDMSVEEFFIWLKRVHDYNK